MLKHILLQIWKHLKKSLTRHRDLLRQCGAETVRVKTQSKKRRALHQDVFLLSRSIFPIHAYAAAKKQNTWFTGEELINYAIYKAEVKPRLFHKSDILIYVIYRQRRMYGNIYGI